MPEMNPYQIKPDEVEHANPHWLPGTVLAWDRYVMLRRYDWSWLVCSHSERDRTIVAPHSLDVTRYDGIVELHHSTPAASGSIEGEAMDYGAYNDDGAKIARAVEEGARSVGAESNESPADQAFGELARAVNDIGKVIAVFEQRLDKVLSPATDGRPASVRDPSNPVSALVRTLRDHTDNLRTTVEHAETILHRLEV